MILRFLRKSSRVNPYRIILFSDFYDYDSRVLFAPYQIDSNEGTDQNFRLFSLFFPTFLYFPSFHGSSSGSFLFSQGQIIELISVVMKDKQSCNYYQELASEERNHRNIM